MVPFWAAWCAAAFPSLSALLIMDAMLEGSAFASSRSTISMWPRMHAQCYNMTLSYWGVHVCSLPKVFVLSMCLNRQGLLHVPRASLPVGKSCSTRPTRKRVLRVQQCGMWVSPYPMQCSVTILISSVARKFGPCKSRWCRLIHYFHENHTFLIYKSFTPFKVTSFCSL
jgi:hypothetical protein